ncbi:hypothetical protein ANASTE_00161 [Anaerofustis stercorihominis DSM 17244]|uniref:Uncharacterized protein n=1 Tax=Anaerofustis stercorihominis DSM 17244 TaxID=445971 RepID=B1C623_9FIRM|nr:hypothetical protein ANASTE_00161 [Anaerofustis stercorihominis DSM 17244]
MVVGLCPTKSKDCFRKFCPIIGLRDFRDRTTNVGLRAELLKVVW